MSACAINRYAAGVVGINVVTMAFVAFVISGAITGLIAGAAVPLSFATASSGLALSLKGFIAAILGGFDKVGLTIVGGVLVGFVESFAASTISSSYQEVIVLGLLLILLVARPAGLTRIRVTSRV
jgi:branched-chain amino acid transport system permease protein